MCIIFKNSDVYYERFRWPRTERIPSFLDNFRILISLEKKFEKLYQQKFEKFHYPFAVNI